LVDWLLGRARFDQTRGGDWQGPHGAGGNKGFYRKGNPQPFVIYIEPFPRTALTGVKHPFRMASGEPGSLPISTKVMRILFPQAQPIDELFSLAPPVDFNGELKIATTSTT
jgi:hypothetical protein